MNKYHLESMRSKIGEILCKQAENDSRIYVLDSDLAKSTTTNMFREKFSERFVECGIAEQSAMSIAEGLACEGKIPFYVNFALFVTGTAWTQLRQACYANSNIKVIGTHPGMDNGPDGASHHANEDLALSRVIPNLKILVPDSMERLKECIELAIAYEGPVYIRVARDVVPVLEDVKYNKLQFGQLDMIRDEGNDVAIIYEGTAAQAAITGYDLLKEKGYKCKAISIMSIKPVDLEMIVEIAKNVRVIVTVENHSVIGGLGSMIAEILACADDTRSRIGYVGVRDVFTESGTSVDIKEKYGITGEKVAAKVLELLE